MSAAAPRNPQAARMDAKSIQQNRLIRLRRMRARPKVTKVRWMPARRSSRLAGERKRLSQANLRSMVLGRRRQPRERRGFRSARFRPIRGGSSIGTNDWDIAGMHDIALLAVAAFAAGVLNTVAGGGTFLTFPALVYAGLPPVPANATSAVAVFPGYLAGAIGFRRELRMLDRGLLLRAAGATILGGLAGSLLLLVSSNESFSAVVPFLLAFATLVFAFGERLQAWARRHAVLSPGNPLGTAVVAVYGGYFNGGLGIVLLALFSLQGLGDLDRMNGLKNGLSFLLSTISVATFALAGLVAWPEAGLMMLAAMAGGYAGAPLARALPRSVVRGLVIAVGAAMSAVFFARLLGG